jgi:hypothetical protein
MAKVVTGPVWKFDAAGQAEGVGNGGVFTNPIFVRSILIEAGAAGGTFEVTESNGGRTLTGALSLAANSEEQIVINGYVPGVYMTSLADGQILVYHGG